MRHTHSLYKFLFPLICILLLYVYINNVHEQVEMKVKGFSIQNVKAIETGRIYEIGGGKFYIYTAISEPSSILGPKYIVVNGWEDIEAVNQQYTCCYKYPDGHIQSRASIEKRRWIYQVALIARQVVCDISDIETPHSIALVVQNETCSNGTFVTPVYREKITTPKFAICAKIAHGNKSSSEIVEWMEYHKMLGVEKMVIYPYEDLNQEAMRVLEYYAKTDSLEIVPLPYVPRLKAINRHFSVGHNRHFSVGHMVMWQDQQVVNFDAQERLKPYTYYTLMDTDEFIVQKGNTTRTLVELMELLSKTTTQPVASFTMHSEIHMLDWNRTNPHSPLKIGQFGYHTGPVLREPKLLHVTAGLKPGSVWIHTSAAKTGYATAHADPGIVVLKHFRKCKQKWVSQNDNKTCVEHFGKLRDHLVEDAVQVIEQRVLDVKGKLGIK